MSMIRKYHNHKPQTTTWLREEEPLNHHETPGRQIKQSNQLSLPHFLRRNLSFAPRSTKEVAYKTLVRPKLEYAAPIWSPHSKLQINQIEKVQRITARWTCMRWRNTSSVGKMLDELEWPLLRPGGTSPPCFYFTRFIVE